MNALARLLSDFENLLAANTIEEIWSLHTARMAEFGFDRLMYGFTRFRTPQSLGNLNDLLILSNHPKPYVDTFVNGGLYKDAPMVTWATNNEGACSWRLIDQLAADGNLTPAEERVIAFNHKNDVRAGYSISFREASRRSKGAIGLCARNGLHHDDVDGIWAESGRQITALNYFTHLRITTMPFAASRPPLTQRQRQVLEWVADGKTIQNIATIMGLTSATIEKHLRLAREALDVETTAQAVLKAAQSNQIFVMP